MKFDYTTKIQKIEDILNNFVPELQSNENDFSWQNLNFSTLPAGVETKHFNQLILPCRNLMENAGDHFLWFCAQNLSKILKMLNLLTN